MLKDYLYKKIPTPIAIGIILVAVIIVGGYTWWQYAEIREEEANIPEVQLPEKKEVKDETADWETYRNEVLNYEIRYPKDWKLHGPGETVYSSPLSASSVYAIGFVKTLEQGNYDNYCDIDIIGGKDSNEAEINNLRNKNYKESQVTIDGISAIHLKEESGAGIADAIYFSHSSYNFRISRNKGFGKEMEEECIDTFNQILSTFRFLD